MSDNNDTIYAKVPAQSLSVHYIVPRVCDSSIVTVRVSSPHLPPQTLLAVRNDGVARRADVPGVRVVALIVPRRPCACRGTEC